MLLRNIFVIVAIIFVWALGGCNTSESERADLVLTNAKIYTVDKTTSWADTIAIKGERIVYVGDQNGSNKYIGNATEEIDLKQRVVMPGFIDGHTHPGMMGMIQYGPSLPKGDEGALLAAVKEYSEKTPGTDWIKLCCWSNFVYLRDGKPGPHKRDLDAVVSNRPVWITSLTGHSFWLNSKGLEVLGVDKNSSDPAPGVSYYVRDENGELTGWIKEGAGWQFGAEHFPPDISSVRDGIDRALKALTASGVMTVFDGGNRDYEDEVYGYLAALESKGKLPLRYEGTYSVYLPQRRHVAVQEMKRLQKAYGGERLRFRTIKLFMDGISPELASGVSKPFNSHPDISGGTSLNVDELSEWLIELHKERFDLHIHAIGDLSVRTILDSVELARAAIGADFYPRVTIAHLEQIAKEDLPRFKALGVSANFTPWWFGRAGGDEILPILGYERTHRMYPASELIEKGGNVTFSSDDWDEDVFTPLLGIQVGHNRIFPDEWSGSEGLDPVQKPLPDYGRVEREDMIKGYTIRGAYPLRMEDDIGSLEVGKFADLVIFNVNPLEANRRAIFKIKPSIVMMEGEIIHGELPQKH